MITHRHDSEADGCTLRLGLTWLGTAHTDPICQLTLTDARLVTVSGMRWLVEQIIAVVKQHVGMGDDAGRSWTGWHSAW